MHKPQTVKPRKWAWLVLFASLPTLICCALPILLVSLGFGSVVAAIYSEYLPFLKWFGLNSTLTFSITIIILLLTAYALYRPSRTCPANPELAMACESTQKWNRRFFWIALFIWIIGAFTTFVMPHLL